MEDNRIPIFSGAFLFGLSIILVIIGMFFPSALDPLLTDSYVQIIAGWIGASVIAGGISLKIYTDKSGNYMGNGEVADSAVSFTAGLSIALYALLATWLWLIGTPNLVLYICLASSLMAFVGIILVTNYWGEETTF